MNEPNKDWCYFRGTVFPNSEELYKAVKYFNSSPLAIQSLNMLMRDLEKDLEVNLVTIKALDERVSNGDMADILMEAMVFIVRKVGELKKSVPVD